MIDLGSSGVVPPARVPKLSGSPSAEEREAKRRERAAGAVDRSRARGSAPTYRRPVTRDQILERYRGARSGSNSSGKDSLRPATGPSDRSSATAPRKRDATDPGRAKSGSKTGLERVRDSQRPAPGAQNRTDLSKRRENAAGGPSLRDLARQNPKRARNLLKNGRRAAEATDLGIRSATAIATGGAVGFGDYEHHGHWNKAHDYWTHGSWYSCYPFLGYWGGHGFYFGWSWYWNWYWYDCGYYWYRPYGYRYRYWGPSPYVYTQVIYEREYVDEGYAVAGGVEEEAPLAVDESFEPADPVLEASLNRAADHYLVLGDRAFREGRYGDAVHFYAKAVEFSPDQGILYLILSDALFATGDYHYAAYCLRKALELDANLATQIVDKHSFYNDPSDFERQIAVLERYLEDHFLDDDARLVLAANYLFGGRPSAAVDLLENPFSLEVVNTPAGKILLENAKAIQYGPVEAK